MKLSGIKKTFEDALIKALIQKFIGAHDDIEFGLVDPNTITATNWGWSDDGVELEVAINASLRFAEGDVDFYGRGYAVPSLPTGYWYVP